MGSDLNDLISFDPPAEVYGPGMMVLCPRPGRPIVGIALADRVASVVTHWIGGRTVPCTAQRGRCVCSDEPLCYPVRPKFYLPILLMPKREQVLLQLAPSGARSILAQQNGDRIGLRGTWVEARRVGTNANSTQAVRLSDDPLPAGLVLPEPADVALVLRRIFYGQ